MAADLSTEYITSQIHNRFKHCSPEEKYELFKDLKNHKDPQRFFKNGYQLTDLELYLKAGGDPNAKNPTTGENMIHSVCAGNYLPNKKASFKKNQAKTTLKEIQKDFIENEKLAHKCIEMINFLISNGCDFDIKNQSGKRPLQLALEAQNHPFIIKHLIDIGATVETYVFTNIKNINDKNSKCKNRSLYETYYSCDVLLMDEPGIVKIYFDTFTNILDQLLLKNNHINLTDVIHYLYREMKFGVFAHDELEDFDEYDYTEKTSNGELSPSFEKNIHESINFYLNLMRKIIKYYPKSVHPDNIRRQKKDINFWQKLWGEQPPEWEPYWFACLYGGMAGYIGRIDILSGIILDICKENNLLLQKDEKDNTALHYVCGMQFQDLVFSKWAKYHLATVIPINLQNQYGNTPLHRLFLSMITNDGQPDASETWTYYTDVHFINHLLENGADPHIKNNKGITVYDIIECINFDEADFKDDDGDLKDEYKEFQKKFLKKYKIPGTKKSSKIDTLPIPEGYPVIPIGRRTVKIYENHYGFTAVLDDESLLCWGWGLGKCDGIDRNPIIPEGRKISEIISTSGAFAAILNDGSLLCWGDHKFGGKTPQLPEGRRVNKVYSNKNAFVALLDDNSVIYWGYETDQWDIKPVVPKGRHIIKVSPEKYDENKNKDQTTFVAILDDGSLMAWGTSKLIGNIPSIPSDCHVSEVYSIQPYSWTASFVARLDNGSLLCWGGADWVKKPPMIPDGRRVVSDVTITERVLSAILDDGSLLCWGPNCNTYKQNQPVVPEGRLVSKIDKNERNFAAILDNGALLWLGPYANASPLLLEGQKVSVLLPSKDSFYALLNDRRALFCCGSHNTPWSMKPEDYCIELLSKYGLNHCISKICSAGFLLAAVLDDGRSILIFNEDQLSEHVSLPKKRHVSEIYSSGAAFAVILDDGSLYCWGNDEYGGVNKVSLKKYFKKISRKKIILDD